MTCISVLGLGLEQLIEANRPTPQRARQKVVNLEPISVIGPSADDDQIAAMVAEFLMPTPGKKAGDQPDPTEEPELYINALIYRGLMRTDRVLFGHGVGKKIARRVIAQATARAAASDVLDRSPLQPEGVAALLAALAIDKEGTKAKLPSIKLP